MSENLALGQLLACSIPFPPKPPFWAQKPGLGTCSSHDDREVDGGVCGGSSGGSGGGGGCGGVLVVVVVVAAAVVTVAAAVVVGGLQS